VEKGLIETLQIDSDGEPELPEGYFKKKRGARKKSDGVRTKKREVLAERFANRKKSILGSVGNVEKNRSQDNLPTISVTPNNTTVSEQKLSWQRRKLKPITNFDPSEFTANVNLRPYLAVTRASEKLADLFRTHAESETMSLLLSPSRFADIEDLVDRHGKWGDLMLMMLLGNFKLADRTKRDLDQTMPFRECFRTTALFIRIVESHPNPQVLTSGQGLGGLLYFALTGQSQTTANFALTMGFPTSSEEILEKLLQWDIADGPFENMTLYGTANALFFFTVGTNTDLEKESHRSRIKVWFTYYFSERLCQEWLDVLGDAANTQLPLQENDRIPFETFLNFFR
jgi:hypothetical protein